MEKDQLGNIIMEDLWNKLGAVIGAIITALGGFYMYDRKTTHDRLTKVENDIVQSKMDIKVIEVRFSELKEDTTEIKSLLREIKDGRQVRR